MVKKNPVRTRICSICKEEKRSTNDETPFICETPCLRTKGREMLLNQDKYRQDVKDTMTGIPITYFIIGAVVTLVVLFVIKLFGG